MTEGAREGGRVEGRREERREEKALKDKSVRDDRRRKINSSFSSLSKQSKMAPFQ